MTDLLPVRCKWHGIHDPEYSRYHDEEWGVPLADPRSLFEKLNLEAFQSGLSWLTILKKRENFRRAFAGFDPEKIARFTPHDVAQLMEEKGIVRNRLKIEAVIANAKAYLKLMETKDFACFLWDFVDGEPLIHRREAMADIPAQSDISQTIAKELKRHGFRFVGPTTMYAFMQSVGMINDHIVDCWRYETCAKMQRAFKLC